MDAAHGPVQALRGLSTPDRPPVVPSHLDFYLAEWCFRFSRRRSGHRGLLFHNPVKQAAHTTPHPDTDLLSPKKGAALKPRRKKQRERRAAGMVGAIRNAPNPNPQRPGGSKTRLDDAVKRRRRRPIPGRRGGQRSQRGES